MKTRLISIESQPKKIFVVVVVVIGGAVVVVVVVIPVVNPRNIPLKFGENPVTNRWNLVDAIVVSVVVVVIVVVLILETNF